MATKIPWCDEVLNVTAGCTKCSDGCLNCYAERMAHRLAHIEEESGRKAKYSNVISPGLRLSKQKHGEWNNSVFCDESVLGKPLHWKKPRRIFIDSMSDLFHPEVPFGFIDKIYATAALCPQHTLLILTKRIGRALEYYKAILTEKVYCENAANEGNTRTRIRHEALGIVHESQQQSKRKSYNMWDGRFPLPNVHFGVSISNQAEADEKIPILLQIPAAVRFLSIEPMLGPIDLENVTMELPTGAVVRGTVLGSDGQYFTPGGAKGTGVDGVIVGGESGPGARPMHPDWPRSIRDQCVAAGVPFYFKQVGEWLQVPYESDEYYKLKCYNKESGAFHQGVFTKNCFCAICEAPAFYRVGRKLAGDLLDGKIWKQLPEKSYHDGLPQNST